MKIQVICDSLSDVPQEMLKKYDIEIIPLTIIIDDIEYKDGVELTPDQFYEKLKMSNEIPKTSQITPVEFEMKFKKHLDEGKTILYIAGSSNATGTYQSSLVAKSMLESDDIYTFDTMGLSYGCGMLVVKAAQMVKEGKTIDEIMMVLEDMKSRVEHLFIVDTLEYLQKGGRISSTKAAIGTILNVKPVLTVENGLVVALDQVRGRKKIVEKMISLANERSSNLKDQTILICHGDNEELVLKLKDAIESEINPKEIIVGKIGPTIGTHSGPGVVAMFYLK